MHYLKVGSEELRDMLFNHSGYPAQMVVDNSDTTGAVWFKWVHAVTAADVFGDVSEPDFIKQMEQRGQVAARLSGAWLMIGAVATALHARRLGIDLERIVERPGTEPEM